jgi:hypothetical protein
MKTLNESALKKFIFLLICAALMVTCIGSAAASSSADQVQSGQLSVTRDEVISNSNQDQLAAVDNGAIGQTSLNSLKVVTNKKGEVKKVTMKLIEVQNVDSSSTVDSTNAIDTSAYQDVNVVKTENGANIDFNQAQMASEQSGGVIKQKQVAVVKVKFKKGDTIVKIKMKQKQKVK